MQKRCRRDRGDAGGKQKRSGGMQKRSDELTWVQEKYRTYAEETD